MSKVAPGEGGGGGVLLFCFAVFGLLVCRTLLLFSFLDGFQTGRVYTSELVPRDSKPRQVSSVASAALGVSGGGVRATFIRGHIVSDTTSAW